MIQPKPYRSSATAVRRQGSLEVYCRLQGERYVGLRTLNEGESVSHLFLEADVAWWL